MIWSRKQRKTSRSHWTICADSWLRKMGCDLRKWENDEIITLKKQDQQEGVRIPSDSNSMVSKRFGSTSHEERIREMPPGYIGPGAFELFVQGIRRAHFEVREVPGDANGPWEPYQFPSYKQRCFRFFGWWHWKYLRIKPLEWERERHGSLKPTRSDLGLLSFVWMGQMFINHQGFGRQGAEIKCLRSTTALYLGKCTAFSTLVF